MPMSINRPARSPRCALASLTAAAALLLAPATGSALVLQQTSPGAATYTATVDYVPMLYSGVGDITAAVTAVDVQLGLGNTNTSGCQASDFAGFAAGNIALLQRGGGCTFQAAAENARAAGATGVLIFNQGNVDTRMDVIYGTLLDSFAGQLDTMVFGLSYGLGAALVNTPGLVMRMQATLTDPNVRPMVVPTPATLPLLALGLLVGAAVRRRT